MLLLLEYKTIVYRKILVLFSLSYYYVHRNAFQYVASLLEWGNFKLLHILSCSWTLILISLCFVFTCMFAYGDNSILDFILFLLSETGKHQI